MTPTYRVEITAKANYTALSWNSKRSGRPTDANLASLMALFDNDIDGAEVIRQSNGEVVATWTRPTTTTPLPELDAFFRI